MQQNIILYSFFVLRGIDSRQNLLHVIRRVLISAVKNWALIITDHVVANGLDNLK